MQTRYSSLLAGVLAAGIAACSLTTVTAALAQKPATKSSAVKGHHADMLATMTKELNLTSAQQAQLKPILASTKTKLDALKKNTTLTPDQKKDQMKELRKEQGKQVAAILTTEQKAKLKEIRAKQKAAREAKAAAAGTTTAAAAPAAPKP